MKDKVVCDIVTDNEAHHMMEWKQGYKIVCDRVKDGEVQHMTKTTFQQQYISWYMI